MIENKGIGKFEKLISNATFGPMQRMLKLYKFDYDEAKESVFKVKKMLAPQIDSSKNTTTSTNGDDESFEKNSKNSVKKFSSLNSPTSGGTTDYKRSPSPHISTSEINTRSIAPVETTSASISAKANLFGQQDIIAPLQKLLEPNEVWTIRRVFRVLNTYCPQNEHDQKLITELEKLIIKEFSNGN